MNQPFAETALLIQGPYQKNITEEIFAKNKNDFNEIVFSTWASDQRIRIPGVKIIKSPIPETNNIHNSQNIYFQTCSMINGLKNISSKFVIKTRSDEYFSNLKFLAKKGCMTNKMIISNIFIKEVSYKKFHISDHLFFADKVTLLETFNLLKVFLEKKEDELNLNIKRDEMPAEVKIALFYLNSKGYKLKDLINCSEKKAFEIMKSEFQVYDIEYLKPYMISASSIGKIKCLKKFCRFDGIHGLNYFKSIHDLAPRNKYQIFLKRIINAFKKRIFNRFFRFFFEENKNY